MATQDKQSEQVKERGASTLLGTGASSSERGVLLSLAVHQPEQLKSLLDVLVTMGTLSERIGEDRSRDLGGGAPIVTSPGQGTSHDLSMRGKAIRSLPPVPVMRRRLVSHLEREVKSLEHSARRKAHGASRGNAYVLNDLYARIRKIQALIADLVRAAADVLERLYIRLFIDHQQLV